MKYTIGEQSFKTQKEIVEYVRTILHRYNLDDILIKEDYNFIYSLLQNHRWKEEKIGCEIRLINSNNGEYESIFLGSFTDPYFIKEYSSSYEIVSEVENYLRNFSKNLRKGE